MIWTEWPICFIMKKGIFAFCLLLFGFYSCNFIDPVELSTLHPNHREVGNLIAISGGVTSTLRRHSIQISSPILWSQKRDSLPGIASVFVSFGGDTIVYEEQERGYYLSKIPFKAEPNVVYRLTVELQSGRKIVASDSLKSTLFLMSLEDVAGLVERSNDQVKLPKHAYMIGKTPAVWAVQFPESAEFEEDKAFETFENLTFSHTSVTPSSLFPSFVESYSFSTWGFDSIQVLKVTPSDGYYRYLSSVFNETDWNMGIFSTINGNAVGNVENGYGFFYVAHEESKRFSLLDFELREE